MLVIKWKGIGETMDTKTANQEYTGRDDSRVWLSQRPQAKAGSHLMI